MHDWVWISTRTFKMSASSDSFTTHEWLRNKNAKTLKQEWFLIEESINSNFRQLVVAIYLLYRCRVENPFAKIHSRKFSRYESSHQFFEVRVESPMFRSTSRVTKILSSTCHRSPELRWLHIGAYHFCILCKSEKYPIWTSSLGLDRNWVEWSWHNTTVCPKCHMSKYHTRLQECWKNNKQ